MKHRPFLATALGCLCAFALAGASLSTSASAQHNATAPATSPSLHALPALPTDYNVANLALISQTQKLRGSRTLLKTGEDVPPFALYDQDAKAVLVPTQWQGKYIVISFIFTRCKMPTMCPAATAKMASLQRALKAKGLEDKVQLLSITFDPEYDSPAVLRQYAQMFALETSSNYALLTGSPEVINSLLRRFGVLTVAENGTINHTMATVLISPEGKLDLRQSGANWTTEAFLEKIQ